MHCHFFRSLNFPRLFWAPNDEKHGFLLQLKHCPLIIDFQWVYFTHRHRWGLPSKMNFHFFQSVNFSSSYGNLSFKTHGFFRKKNWVFIFFSRKIIVSEKNCQQNLNLFLKELASRIFYFSIFPLWNLECDVTGWTILIRIFDRSTSYAFRTLN